MDAFAPDWVKAAPRWLPQIRGVSYGLAGLAIVADTGTLIWPGDSGAMGYVDRVAAAGNAVGLATVTAADAGWIVAADGAAALSRGWEKSRSRSRECTWPVTLSTITVPPWSTSLTMPGTRYPHGRRCVAFGHLDNRELVLMTADNLSPPQLRAEAITALIQRAQAEDLDGPPSQALSCACSADPAMRRFPKP